MQRDHGGGPYPTCPLDADGDGWLPCAGDCDDADPGVSPEAEELCNGVDDDCDGRVDTEDEDVVSRVEACDGGLDEDCDQQIDQADPDCRSATVPGTDPGGGGDASGRPLPRAWFCRSAPGGAWPALWVLLALLPLRRSR